MTGRNLLLAAAAVVLLAWSFSRLALPGTDPDARPYDVTRYELDLALDPETATLAGRNTVTLVASSELASVRFDAGSAALRIDSVTSGARRLEFRHERNVLEVFLSIPLRPSQTVALTIHYRGRSTFDGRYDSGGIYFARTSTGTTVGTISQPNFARHWWPCNDRPSDKALVTLRCTVPAGMTVVSNGRLLAKQERGDRHIFSWGTKTPIATYLVFVAASEYLVSRDTILLPGGRRVPTAIYAFPEDSAKAAEDFRNAGAILSWFSEIFAPYPFAEEQFAVVEVDGRLTMENQTVVAMERGMVTGDRANENTFVHEIAHQWWGNLLTPVSWRHTWLSEGFATYSEALYVGARRGPAVYREYIDLLMDQPPGFYAGSVIGQDENAFWDSFGPAVYYKGAICLHMLRRMMGDGAFFAALRAYAADPALAYRNVSTDDFRRHCERASGLELAWFFDQWVHADRDSIDRAGIVYHWTQRPAAAGAGVEVRVTARQEPAVVPPWRLPFRIRVHSGGGHRDFPVVDSLARQEFVLHAEAAADSVLLDPDRDLFMTVTRGRPE